MPSDSELLQRFTLENSQEAFTELVKRHIDFVYATAARLAGSDARAEDVTQAVFTDLAKKAASLADRNDLVGWLHTSTRYAAASLRRREARREAREQTAHAMHAESPSNHKPIDWDKLRPLLDDALHQLGPYDRDAVLLRYFKQSSFGEIGVALGLSEEAARKRVDRGVDKLRGLLAKRGITSTFVALELAMAAQAAVAAPTGLASTVAATSLAAAAQAATFFAQLFASLKTAAAVVSVIAAVTSGALAVRSTQVAHEAERALASNKRHLADLEKERERLEKRYTELDETRKAEQKLLSELRASTAARIQRIWPKESGEKIVDALLQFDLDAEMEAALKNIEPVLFSTQYFFGPLFTELKLTPQQIERFLKISRGNAPLSPSYKFIDEGNGHGQFTFALGWHNADEDETALKSLLGETGFTKYHDYCFRKMSLRTTVVNKLASNLLYTTVPLDAETANRLTELLAQTMPEPNSPNLADIEWEKALKEAKSILTPIQLKALARLSGNLSTQWSYVF